MKNNLGWRTGDKQKLLINFWKGAEYRLKETSQSRFMDVRDVMEVLRVSQSGAYSIIRNLNRELENQGFLTVRGKIPAAYLCRRFYIQPGDEL